MAEPVELTDAGRRELRVIAWTLLREALERGDARASFRGVRISATRTATQLRLSVRRPRQPALTREVLTLSN